MTLAFWQAGNLPAAGARRCATGRAWSATARRRTASPRASTRTWAPSTSRRSPPTAPSRAHRATPTPGSASAGCGCASATASGRSTRWSARDARAELDGLLDLALAYQLAGDLGGEVSACEHAVRAGRPDSEVAWSRLAHALARTDRLSEAIEACEHALALAPEDPEVDDLLARLRDALPRVLPAA